MELGFLISSPQMKDRFFEGTLILLCHHDRHGALGLVVNRETNITIDEVVAQMDLGLEGNFTGNVLWGGPVEPVAGFIVTRGKVQEEQGWNVGHGIMVSQSRESLVKALTSPEPYHLCLGYSGWGPEQLDGEIAAGSWLYTDVDPDILLNCPTSQRYDRALALMGIRADQVWMRPIDE